MFYTHNNYYVNPQRDIIQKKYNMKSDPILMDWVTKRNLSENTIDSYRHTFEQYINFLNTTNNTNYTLTDLLKEAEEDERS